MSDFEILINHNNMFCGNLPIWENSTDTSCTKFLWYSYQLVPWGQQEAALLKVTEAEGTRQTHIQWFCFRANSNTQNSPQGSNNILESFVTLSEKKNPLEIFWLKEKIMKHINIPIFQSRSEIVVKITMKYHNFVQNCQVF